MAIVNKMEPQRKDIPHEPGEWMKFRPLSWQELNQAGEEQSATLMRRAANIPAEAMANIRELPQQATAAPTDDDSDQYDQEIILNLAITEWSYEDELTSENVASLDKATADWAYKVAVEMNTRSKSEGEGSGPASEPTTEETPERAGPSS